MPLYGNTGTWLWISGRLCFNVYPKTSLGLLQKRPSRCKYYKQIGFREKHSWPLIHNHVPVFSYNGMIGPVLVKNLIFNFIIISKHWLQNKWLTIIKVYYFLPPATVIPFMHFFDVSSAIWSWQSFWNKCFRIINQKLMVLTFILISGPRRHIYLKVYT